MDPKHLEEMISYRRKFHQFPEEGWTEFETTYFIVSKLKQMGYETILTGKQIINPQTVMGRDKAKVREAIDRSVKDGVPLDFIESCDGYTGAIAILDTG